MKQYSFSTIRSILNHAVSEFLSDDSAPDSVFFNYRGHLVEAHLVWSYSHFAFYVDCFFVHYPDFIMRYFCGLDYELSDALCC